MLPLSLCGLAQAWSVRGTPSRGGPGGSSLAGLRGRAAGAGRSGVADSRGAGKHGEFAQGMYMCEIPSLVFTGNVYVFTQGSLLRCVSRKRPGSGWTRGVVPLPPRDGALRFGWCQRQRDIARCLGVHTGWCAHSRRKAPGNDRTLCPRVPGNDQTLCLRGGRAARLLYASLPTRATHEDSLRDSRRGARLLGGSPKLGCWCLLWRAFFPLPTWS